MRKTDKIVGTNDANCDSMNLITAEQEPPSTLFILSLCSERLFSFLKENANLPFLNSKKKYEFVYLKEQEINNLLFFDKAEDRAHSRQILDKRIQVLRNIMHSNPSLNIRIIDYDEIAPEIQATEITLTNLYKKKKSFYRAVNNQIYKNLHPKLKRKNIKNSRDARLEKLAPFLIVELATLIHYTQEKDCTELLSTCKPMRVFEQILEDRYPIGKTSFNKQFKFRHLLADH